MFTGGKRREKVSGGRRGGQRGGPDRTSRATGQMLSSSATGEGKQRQTSEGGVNHRLSAELVPSRRRPPLPPPTCSRVGPVFVYLPRPHLNQRAPVLPSFTLFSSALSSARPPALLLLLPLSPHPDALIAFLLRQMSRPIWPPARKQTRGRPFPAAPGLGQLNKGVETSGKQPSEGGRPAPPRPGRM